MMLAPKEFDPVNRDLEIRDLYNMEDAFHLGDSYPGAYRARLDANLALLGRPRRDSRLARRRGRRPPAHRPGARRLPGRRRHQALRRAGVVPRDRARRPARRAAPDLRRPGPERRRDGHDLHPARQRRERSHHPRRGRPATRPATATFPYLAPPNPDPPEPSRAPLTMEGRDERDGRVTRREHRPRARRHPGRRAVRAPLAVRRHLPAAAHRRPRRRPRAGPAAAPARRARDGPRPTRPTTPRSPSRSPTTG